MISTKRLFASSDKRIEPRRGRGVFGEILRSPQNHERDRPAAVAQGESARPMVGSEQDDEKTTNFSCRSLPGFREVSGLQAEQRICMKNSVKVRFVEYNEFFLREL